MYSEDDDSFDGTLQFESSPEDVEQNVAGEYKDLSEAVRNHPSLAIEALANRFGLDFEKISSLMRRNQARQQKSQQEATKRPGVPLEQATPNRAPGFEPPGFES